MLGSMVETKKIRQMKGLIFSCARFHCLYCVNPIFHCIATCKELKLLFFLVMWMLETAFPWANMKENIRLCWHFHNWQILWNTCFFCLTYSGLNQTQDSQSGTGFPFQVGRKHWLLCGEGYSPLCLLIWSVHLINFVLHSRIKLYFLGNSELLHELLLLYSSHCDYASSPFTGLKFVTRCWEMIWNVHEVSLVLLSILWHYWLQ